MNRDLKVKDVLILRTPGDGSPDDVSAEDSLVLRDGESGPTEVCYMVGTKIVCWSPEEEEEV